MFFGGSKSSSTTTNLNEEINKNFVDYGAVSEGSTVTKSTIDAGGDVNLSMLDGGSVSKAFDFAGLVAGNNAELSRQQIEGTEKAISSAIKAATESSRSGAEAVSMTVVQYGALAFVVVTVAYFVTRKRKGS